MTMTSVSRWLRRHRFSQRAAWLLFSALLVTGTTYAYLTDGAIHAPPVGGTFDYNSFKPGAAGFPAVGGSYTDPVFGGAVLRLSARSGQANDQLYAHHFANADGTFAFEIAGATPKVISAVTGAVLWSGAQVPTGGGFSAEMAWDAVDPDKYYFFSGASLMRRNLAAQTNTTVHTFPAALESQGGSLNYQSADGRYFLVKYGGTSKVWDSQTNTTYSGSVTPLDPGGWVSITPDGNYVVTVAGQSTPMPQQEHYSYAINHGTQSISATPTQFWGMSGDHGVIMSATDGKSYYIGFNSFDVPSGLYRVDITLNQSGKTVVQQTSSNLQLINLGFFDSGGHLCAVSKGPLRDWVFLSTEADADTYNSGVGGWTAYRQEIIAVNVLTGEVRRLAHHRSRGLTDGAYWNQPRITCSWDGSVVLWNSNFNTSSPFGYADLYAIRLPATAAGPPIPQNLRFK